MARRKDKYDVDPDLIRSLEEDPDNYEYDEDEYDYEDEPLSSGRVKWAWIFLFLALGVLIGSLVFSLVSKNQAKNEASTTLTTSIVSTENELLTPTATPRRRLPSSAPPTMWSRTRPSGSRPARRARRQRGLRPSRRHSLRQSPRPTNRRNLRRKNRRTRRPPRHSRISPRRTENRKSPKIETNRNTQQNLIAQRKERVATWQ